MQNIKVIDKNSVKILSDSTTSVDVHLAAYDQFVNVMVNGLIVVVEKYCVRVYDETDTQLDVIYLKDK
jgi:hypothetical protein